MPAVTRQPVPEDSLLTRFPAGDGHHTDAYTTVIAAPADLSAYVEAFYTTPLFKTERLILRLIGRGDSDENAARLARGQTEAYAAWRQEARTEDQILMRDISGRTGSWLRVEPFENGTRLWFGSVVTAVPGKDDKPRLGFWFDTLMGFHGLYSRALLWSAARRLAR